MRAPHFSISSALQLSILAGIMYNSWPIGYWLNPVASKSGLASGLEARGQPYSWVFVSGDILSSLIIVASCLMLWFKFRKSTTDRYIEAVLLLVASFGLFTIIDTLYPERCVPNLRVCPNFTHDHLLLIHGIFSILASVLLFISFCLVWFRQQRSLLLNAMLISYIMFGLISILEVFTPGKNGNWSQHYYITLCSIWIALVPYSTAQLVTTDAVTF